MSRCKPHLMLFAAMANLGIAAFAAAAADAPAQDPAQDPTASPGLTIPLGPPQASVPVNVPVDRNAFPADILARMREALVAQAESPGRALRHLRLPPRMTDRIRTLALLERLRRHEMAAEARELGDLRSYVARLENTRTVLLEKMRTEAQNRHA